MSTPHMFVVGPYPRLCQQCGREQNDYQYHLPPGQGWVTPTPAQRNEQFTANLLSDQTARVHQLEALLRRLVEGEHLGSWEEFGLFASCIADEARELLK